MRGTVLIFMDRKGCGFIAPEGGGRDVYVHYTALPKTDRGLRTLTVGEKVEFDTEPNERKPGTLRAKNVRRLLDFTPAKEAVR